MTLNWFEAMIALEISNPWSVITFPYEWTSLQDDETPFQGGESEALKRLKEVLANQVLHFRYEYLTIQVAMTFLTQVMIALFLFSCRLGLQISRNQKVTHLHSINQQQLFCPLT